MTNLKIKGRSMYLYVLIMITLSVLFSSQVLSLGLIPASESILLGTDKQEFQINIMNTDKGNHELELVAQGELANYVSFDKNTISLRSDKDYETVNVKLNIDENHDLIPGEYLTRIIISSKDSGQGEVSAKVALAFRLTTMIPYEGAFLDVSLYAPNFDKNKGGNFVVQAQNKGSQNAVHVVPIVDIYSSTNQKITTLKGEERMVKVGETVNFALPLNEDLENGKYLAKASIIYSGTSRVDEKVFTVGSPDIVIDSISTLSFKLGGIAGFDLFLLNNWGEEIKGVYADVEFKKGNELLEKTTTATVNIDGMERSRLQAYWDTKEMTAGPYSLVINLHYLGKTKTEQHDIVLEANKINVIGTGKVIEESESDGAGLLVLVIFIMVLLNGLLIYKFVIKKKS